MCGFSKILARAALQLLVVLSSLSVMAASDDVLLVFSTRGPDHYAEGAPVQEGEMYAVVWMAAGREFAGFDMNGKVLDADNNALIVAMPLARYSERIGGGYCPITMFRISGSVAKDFVGGTYALALLDTRAAAENGDLVPSGKIANLKGWSLVEKSSISAVVGGGVGQAIDAGAENGTTVSTSSEVPAGEDVPQPRITGIKVQDGYVRLTVKGTSPRLLYNVAAGAHPGRRTDRRAALSPIQGHARADREIELIVPVRDDQSFFTVTQN